MSKKEKIFFSVLMVASSFAALAYYHFEYKYQLQNIAIADDAFRACLENNKVEDVRDVKEIKCRVGDVTSLEGIEHIANVEIINVDYNELDTLDLSSNLKLNRLSAAHNQIVRVNLVNNLELFSLYLNSNEIEEIDLSTNNKLEVVNLGRNELKKIDIADKINLKRLYVYENAITEVNLSGTDNLRLLKLERNELSTIDLSTLPGLEVLDLELNRKLDNLDISHNQKLKDLSIDLTEIRDLDISKNPELAIYRIQHKRYMLKFKKQTYTKLEDVPFEDEKFKSCVLEQGVMHVSELLTVNCYNKGIDSILGVEYLTSLKVLNVGHNNIAKIDLRYTTFEQLYAASNQIERFEMAVNPWIKSLILTKNKLSTIYVERMVNLESLIVDRNYLYSIALPKSGKLKYLDLVGNKLTYRPLVGLTGLNELHVDNNKLHFLSVKDSKQLQFLTAQNNQLESIDLSNNTLLSKQKLLLDNGVKVKR